MVIQRFVRLVFAVITRTFGKPRSITFMEAMTAIEIDRLGLVAV